MIFALFFNGASVVPLFVPFLPQAALIYFTFRCGGTRLLNSPPSSVLLISLSFLALATVAGMRSESDSLLKLYKLLGNSLIAIFIANALANRYRGSFSFNYSDAVLKMSVLGILGLLLTSLTDWHITANIAERAYHTNFLTVWISDSDFNSSQALFSPLRYRLQCFFDEPGTYGMLLIPAFFHFLDSGAHRKAGILAVCIFLTESANAWGLAAILTLWKFFSLRRWPHKLAIFGLFVAIGGTLYPYVVKLYEIKVGLDEAYLNNSSFGTRSLEYGYVVAHFMDHLSPLTRVQEAYADLGGISSSYVAWYVLGGWIFLLICIWVLFALLRIAFIARTREDQDSRFALVLAVVLFFSGFQRTSFLDTILFMSLFYWSLLQGRSASLGLSAHGSR